MKHKPILLQNLSLSFPHKTCFEDFSTQIHAGSHIALIGRNGAGKSSLLIMIKKLTLEQNLTVKYIPQIIDNHVSLSGGQKFNKSLMEAIRAKPDLLLLDEPTNHLDEAFRQNLIKNLEYFQGTIIVISHDVELLKKFKILWHINNRKIEIFSGNYYDYMKAKKHEYNSIEHEVALLNKQKKSHHEALMHEQARAKKSREQGEKHIGQRKWPTIVSDSKARRAEETSGRKKSAIFGKKEKLIACLSEIYKPEIIKPKFSLCPSNSGSKNLVHILEGSCGYEFPILQNISFSINSGEKIALLGPNGCGKSTLVKAILGDKTIIKTGNWYVENNIGYLNQHYDNLDFSKTILETMENIAPNWSHIEIRRHLNNFLFRKNEEVNIPIYKLSGGEKVRISLAKIAARVPKLLILDEVTNNLDLEIRQHVIEVLSQYPGAMIVISHDKDFLEDIGVIDKIEVSQFKLH